MILRKRRAILFFYLKFAKLDSFWAGIFINSQSNINEVSKASATDSVSQWQGQAKNGSSPKQIWRWWYWQQRASSGETLINSVSGGRRELHKFIPGPPDCQKSRIRICWFYKLYFAYSYLYLSCQKSGICKEDDTALFLRFFFRKKGIWIMSTQQQRCQPPRSVDIWSGFRNWISAICCSPTWKPLKDVKLVKPGSRWRIGC